VARLAVQTLEIIGQCNLADATRDGVVDIYINSLMKKLLRCWEIAERYRLDFNQAGRILETARCRHADGFRAVRGRLGAGVPQFFV